MRASDCSILQRHLIWRVGDGFFIGDPFCFAEEFKFSFGEFRCVVDAQYRNLLTAEIFNQCTELGEGLECLFARFDKVQRYVLGVATYK